ncbi:MAG: hypothetical protein ACRCSQ_00925 [Bacteroidales bacterium]
MKYSFLTSVFALFLILSVSGCKVQRATIHALQSDSLIYQSIKDRLFRIDIKEMVDENGPQREMLFPIDSYIQVMPDKAIVVTDPIVSNIFRSSYREDKKYKLSELKINKKREIEFSLTVDAGYTWFPSMVITVYPASDKCTIRHKRNGNISGTIMTGTFYPFRE